MKPWQIMTLFTIGVALITFGLDSIFPDYWLILNLAGAVAIVLVGRRIL